MTGLEKPEISNDFLKSRIGPPRIVKTDGFERLFSHYTGLEGEELIDYLKDFQAKALAIHHYGCIANGGFAALRERRHGDYDEVVKFASQGRQLYVDIGCCLGTDVREFLLDGGDANGSNRIVAVDLLQDFIDLGQKLYKGPTKGIEFRTANVLDNSDTRLDDLKGKVNILYTGAVFHLFLEDDQRTMAELIAKLLSRDGETIAFGAHRGASKKGRRPHPVRDTTMFSHDPESWKEMWREILGDDAKNWTMETSLHKHWTGAEYSRVGDGAWLQWSLWRNKPSS